MAVFCARMRYIFELKVADLLIDRDIIFDQKADRSYIYAKP